MVELIDIGVTICDACQVTPHDQDQGISLHSLLHNETTSHRDDIYAEMGCDRMIFDGRYKLMFGEPGSDTRQLGRLHLDKPVNITPSPIRLYDLKEDPKELHDLSSMCEYQALLTELKERLLMRILQNTQALSPCSRGEYNPL